MPFWERKWEPFRELPCEDSSVQTVGSLGFGIFMVSFHPSAFLFHTFLHLHHAGIDEVGEEAGRRLVHFSAHQVENCIQLFLDLRRDFLALHLLSEQEIITLRNGNFGFGKQVRQQGFTRRFRAKECAGFEW